ncbi:MAG: hypothetical protein JXR86_02070 [Spirochaetales bacterium]|nr:hypothetical protein [Spirochaetales bacterium]
MKINQLAIIPFFLFASISLQAQEEDLDSLFDEPQEDIVVEEPEVDHRAQFEESKKVSITGAYKARGLVGAGWTSWDFVHDIKEGFNASAGLESSLSVSFDARPASELRIFGTVSTAFDPYASLQEAGETATAEALWTAPGIDALYADYILKDTLFTRLGKFSVGWGQGRFYTPGNLMSGSSNSDFNLRLTLPSLAGVTFILLTNDSTYYGDFTYGGKADFVFGSTMISPALTYKDSDGFKALLSFKQVIFKTDFLIDTSLTIKDSELASLYAVAGFFREWGSIKLYGEYQYSCISTTNDHVASIAFGVNNPLGAPLSLGVQWEQNFMDWSGSVTPVMTMDIFPLLKMTIGLPIIYGSDDSYAVLKNSDPEGRRIALGLALELSGSF